MEIALLLLGVILVIGNGVIVYMQYLRMKQADEHEQNLHNRLQNTAMWQDKRFIEIADSLYHIEKHYGLQHEEHRLSPKAPHEGTGLDDRADGANGEGQL